MTQQKYYDCSTKKNCPVKRIVVVGFDGTISEKIRNSHNHEPLSVSELNLDPQIKANISEMIQKGVKVGTIVGQISFFCLFNYF